MFDIFYMGNNTELQESLPFAKQVDNIGDAKSNTKMFWFIEPNIQVTDIDIFGYRPESYDMGYTHVWKWDNQNYGGVTLLPKAKSEGTKEINKVVCKKSFEKLHTKTPGKYFDNNPYASHVWCIDKDYKIPEDINWAPNNFEPNFIHSFHLRGQLEHKYPDKEGGIKLYPKEWKDANIKFHNFLDIKLSYPVMLITNVEDYRQRNTFNEDYVWLVDASHKVNLKTFDWVPSPFEDGMTHVFRMPYQLQEKYPMAMGGIRLVPKKWKEAEVKIHPACPIEDESYDVFYVDEDEFTADAYTEYAERSKTDWFWVVDREFTFNGKLLFVPALHEKEFIHVFKVPDMLQERYPLDNTTPWDNRCGGIRLVNKNFDMTKHKYQVNINPVKYDIFYTDNVNDYESSARKSRTKMFWLIDQEYQLDNTFNTVVPKHEQNYILNFQVSDQLRHKYPEKEGGIYLIPKNFNEETQIKYKGYINNDNKAYPIVKVSDIDKLSDITQDCWIVDNEYQIDEKINWAPSTFEKNSIHTFHVPGQLQHKYPDQMGGLRWVPLDWDGNYVIHSEYITATLHYPILRVSNVEDLDVVNTDCWLIDEGYELTTTIDWAPPYFERNSIHVFHIGSQLRSKYPEEMGGMRWVPLDWNGEYVIHEEFLLVEKEYPVYFVDDPTTEPDLYESSWQADKLYKIQAPINWVPDEFDKDKIHVFHVYQQLTEKYTESMGGLYWYPADRTNATLKIHEKPLLISPTKYPVYFVDDPKDFSTVTEDCWLIDKDYVISDNITIVPWQNEIEKQMVHVYQVRGQLAHKYPEEMGGIYWVPASWKTADTKIHDITPFGDNLQFETYDNEETGRKKSSTGWFWVVDPDVTVNEDFDFGFIPKVWDNGKTHVWQKLNPITGRQYDYSGVMLCPKVAQTKGRPKYIREPSCTQNEYPIYYLQASDYENGLQSVYERLSAQSDSNMYWVVDAFTQIDPDFKFDYYPTQWDQKYIHVFLNQDNAYTSVRLVPKQLFLDNEYTDKEIENNSFEHLKQINTIASLRPVWPVIHLQSLEKNEFINAIKEIETPFVWTVDPDVKVDKKLLDRGYLPTITSTSKVHAWQKLNPISKKVHAYGGLRLWPTSNDYSDIKSDDLKLNRIKNINYVKEIGSKTIPYDIIFLSYKEPNADNGFQRLQDHLRINNLNFNLIWVRDVEGIFEAHKIASTRVSSKMFWVIDADAELVEDFIFDYIPDVYDQEVVHVWSSKNPITQDEYGYGGVKLFPTDMVRKATSWGLDFTTGLSNRFKSMPQVSCITKFNTDAFSTWRSAFRECVKLTLNDDAESKQRLDTWINTRGEEEFTADAVSGALAGNQFALANKDNLAKLDKINDFDWLREEYDRS